MGTLAINGVVAKEVKWHITYCTRTYFVEVYQVGIGVVVCEGLTINCSYVYSSEANVYS